MDDKLPLETVDPGTPPTKDDHERVRDLPEHPVHNGEIRDPFWVLDPRLL